LVAADGPISADPRGEEEAFYVLDGEVVIISPAGFEHAFSHPSNCLGIGSRLPRIVLYRVFKTDGSGIDAW